MREILQAAELSHAVYDLDTPAGLGIVGAESIQNTETDTSGLAYFAPYGITIAFAGSATRKDWMTNADARKRDCYGWFPAHAGFARCAESVIDKCLEIAAHADRPITLTGHSQGGAVALLVAIGLAARSSAPRKINVITFGQPRVSTATNISHAFRGDYTRVVNGSDIVPRVPKLGFSHGGRCLYLRNGGGYCMNPGWTELVIDRMTAWQHDRITDHLMPDYLRQLQRIKS